MATTAKRATSTRAKKSTNETSKRTEKKATDQLTPNHAERKHARLSPSSAHRWLHCTKSASFEALFPETTSEYAQEGTTAHEVCEALLTGKDYTQIVGATEEMVHHAQRYAEYIDAIQSAYKDPSVFYEVKLDLTQWVPEGFGTADCVIIGDTDLHVIDYKYGRGVRVEVEGNEQLMIYALGAWAEFGWCLPHDIAEVQVHMHIYQPRTGNVGEYTMPLTALLWWGNNILTKQAQLAHEGEGVYLAGSHCTFCKGAGACKVRLSEEMQVFEQIEEQVGENNLAEGELLAKWLQASERIKATLDAVQGYSLTLAQQQRGAVPGFKVVEKRTIRRWQNEDELIGLLTQKGYSEGDFLKKSLKGIGDLTKLLKGSEVDIDKYLYKPQGAPELAPITDKREELVDDQTIFNA